nr:transcription factor SOX-6-like [Dermacentor andersoni]
MDIDPGESQRSSSASLQQTTNRTHLRSIPRLLSQPAAEAATAAYAVASDTTVAGASLSSEVQHSYQLRSRIQRPPNAFMLVAHEKMRSVAAEKPNEDNQRVSSHLGMLWRSLSAADKEPYQHKPSAAAAVPRRKQPGYANNPREAQRCKRQERMTKAISRKLNDGICRDQEQQPSISVAVAEYRGTPDFQQQQHPPPPPKRNEHCATSAAWDSDSGAGQGMLLPRPPATVAATASATTCTTCTGSSVLCRHQCEGPAEKPLCPQLTMRGGDMKATELRTTKVLINRPERSTPGPPRRRQGDGNPSPAFDPGVKGASLSSEVQHSYELRPRIPRPPNAFMLVAHEKRWSVAAEKPNENNQRVSSRLGKLWRSLSAGDKEPYQCKAAEFAAVRRRKHPDYV